MDSYFRAGSAQGIPHYDCRPFLRKVVKQTGSPQLFLGVLYIVYGVVDEIFYLVAMIAMFSPKLRSLSCYKIMIVLGIYDILATFVISILNGYFLIIGAWYCTHPDLLYIQGCVSLGLWCGSCMTCFVLVINRLIDLWKPHLMNTFFGGYRVFIFLLVPFSYSCYLTIWTNPVILNSPRMAMFFDPFITEEPGEREMYANYSHVVNNLLIVLSACVLYSFVITVLRKKFKQGQEEGSAKMNKTQLSVIIQTTAICVANFLAAVVYVYLQWFPAPVWLIVFGYMCWLSGHGTPAFVYLLMNKTIQNEVKRVFGRNKKKSTSTGIVDGSKRTVPQNQAPVIVA